MTLYLAPPALGLGDLIVTLPVVSSLVAQYGKVKVVARAEAHVELLERLPGLEGVVLEWQLKDENIGAQDRIIDLRDHPLQKNFWWGSDAFEAAYPGWRINDILRQITSDMGLKPNLDLLESFRFTNRLDAAGKIAFVPGSAFSFKCWPVENWQSLAKMCTVTGLPYFVVGQPDESAAVKELVDCGFPWIDTPSLGDVVDVVSSAAAVVSVDTGIMHLAVHQKKPTISLYRRNPVYLRPYPHVVALTAKAPCLDVCYDEERRCAHNSRPAAGPGFKPADWSCQAPRGTGCMSEHAALEVFDALRKVLVDGSASAAQAEKHELRRRRKDTAQSLARP